jgi:hypothetical protein
MNPPEWRDYFKVSGADVHYRVVAIACEDTSSTSISNTVAVSKKEINKDYGEELIVYPNPANEIVFLNYPSIENGLIDIKVFNISGNLILRKTKTHADGESEINCSNLNSGIYFIEINYSNGKKIISKLIIK